MLTLVLDFLLDMFALMTLSRTSLPSALSDAVVEVVVSGFLAIVFL